MFAFAGQDTRPGVVWGPRPTQTAPGQDPRQLNRHRLSGAGQLDQELRRSSLETPRMVCGLESSRPGISGEHKLPQCACECDRRCSGRHDLTCRYLKEVRRDCTLLNSRQDERLLKCEWRFISVSVLLPEMSHQSAGGSTRIGMAWQETAQDRPCKPTSQEGWLLVVCHFLGTTAGD